MKRLPEIEAAYLRVDAHLEETRSRSAGHLGIAIEAAQALNDQAYFVLSWGQMEAEINDRCGDVIRARQLSSNWQVRRGWDRFDPDNLRRSGLMFEHRLTIVLDPRESKPNKHGLALQYYATRNQIAHGRLLSQRVDVAEAIADFQLISAEISRHAP